MTRKIWIDLTDLPACRGHFTGIQRVIYKIAKEYSGDPSVGFFYFDRSRKNFRAIEFATAVKGFSNSEAEYNVVPNTANKRNRLKSFLKRSVRPSYWNYMILAKSKGEALARDLLNFVSSVATVDFQPDDIVCILGAGWYKKDMIAALLRQKNHTDFILVHVIYDFIPVFFPHLFGPGFYEQFTRYLFDVFSVSDHLVAISNSTRNDALLFCEKTGLPVPPIDVIRLGEDFAVTREAECPAGLDNSIEYILCVGTLEVRKNHQLLYQAYRLAYEQGCENLPKIVIVGRPGWLVDDLMYILNNDPLINRDFIFLNSATDAELKWLYQHCLFTVYPSLYEGWGLPIAESLSYDKFCIASKTSSMTEIGGDLLEYFSPFDAASCLGLITKYSANKELLIQKEDLIKRYFEKTTWHDTYREFDNILRKANKRSLSTSD